MGPQGKVSLCQQSAEKVRLAAEWTRKYGGALRAGGRDSGMTGRQCRPFAKRQKQTLFILPACERDLQRWGLRTAKHNTEDFRAVEPLLPGTRFSATEELRLIINKN